MTKLLKYLVYSLITVVVICAIGIGILLATLNPNDLKNPISQQVENLTGRKFTINGAIEWKIFPWLGIQMHDIQLDHPSGFDDTRFQKFARLQKADATLRLLPLLRRKLEFKSIELTDLQINLIKKVNSKDNWQDLMKAHSIQAEKTQSIVKANEKTSSLELSPLDLTIANLSVKNASINFVDQKANKSYSIKNLNLQSKNIGLNRHFPIQLEFMLSSLESKREANILLDTSILLNQAQQTIAVSPLILSTTIKGSGIQKQGVAFDLKTGLTLDLKQQQLSVPSFSIKFSDLQLQGKLTGHTIFTNPLFTGDLTLQPFNPSLLSNQLGFDLPKLQDPKVLQRMSLQTQFQLNTNTFAFTNLRLDLDKNHLTGSATLAMKGASSFDLNLDDINFSNYQRQPITKAKTTPTPTADKSITTQENKADAVNLPIQQLRKLNVIGNLKIDKMTFNKIQASKLTVGINADSGLIKISPMTTLLYDGNLSIGATLDVRNTTPKLTIVEKMTGVQIEPLFTALSQQKSIPLRGKISFNSHVNSQGSTVNQLLRNLNGEASFALQDGLIKGINLGYQLDWATALANRQLKPIEKDSKDTPFSVMNGTLQIKQGIATNNDLQLTSPRIKVQGAGTLNLVNQRVDYNLKMSAIPNNVDAKIINAQKQLGGSFPIKVSGTFTNLRAYPDPVALTQGIASGFIKKQLERMSPEATDQVEKIGGKLQKQLESIFK